MNRKIGALIIGATLVLAGFAWKWHKGSAQEWQVPDLTNKSLLDAIGLLSKYNIGLRLKKGGLEPNETVPAGVILSQQPPAGAAIREGKTIRVTVSQGPEMVPVPDLTGQIQPTAEAILRIHGLTPGAVQNRPSVRERDVVIAQETAPATLVKKNAPVNFTVSSGPPKDGTVLMPDFVGKKWESVLSWAKSSKMPVEKIGDTSNAPGIVTQQDFPPDKILHKNIQFTVSADTNTLAPAPSPARPKN